jgi:enoyl-CoA hydratase/carnithine racemase
VKQIKSGLSLPYFVMIFSLIGMGGTHFLPELVGPAVAADLLLTGRTVAAEELLELKIVSKVNQNPKLCNVLKVLLAE